MRCLKTIVYWGHFGSRRERKRGTSMAATFRAILTSVSVCLESGLSRAKWCPITGVVPEAAGKVTKELAFPPCSCGKTLGFARHCVWCRPWTARCPFANCPSDGPLHWCLSRAGHEVSDFHPRWPQPMGTPPGSVWEVSFIRLNRIWGSFAHTWLMCPRVSPPRPSAPRTHRLFSSLCLV